MTKTALIAWELGSGLGHLAIIRSLVEPLKGSNYRVVVAVKDFSRVHHFFDNDPQVTLVQAPIWSHKIKMQRPTICLADVLLTKGYLEVQTLQNLITAWRGLFSTVKPDLLICNYAPTAMLASFGSEIPRMLVGNGYPDPVPGVGLINWSSDKSQDKTVAMQEQQLIKIVKAAEPKANAISNYSDLYRCDATIINVIPALDAYKGKRKEALYCAPETEKTNQLTKLSWKTKNKKILAYLMPGTLYWQPAIEMLKRLNAEVLVVAPGAHANLLTPLVNQNFRATNQIIDMPHLVKEANLFIGHGNMGTTCEALLEGVPVIALPLHLEHQFIGRRVEDLGAGYVIKDVKNLNAMYEMLLEGLENQTLKNKARQLSEKADEYFQGALDVCFANEVNRLTG